LILHVLANSATAPHPTRNDKFPGCHAGDRVHDKGETQPGKPLRGSAPIPTEFVANENIACALKRCAPNGSSTTRLGPHGEDGGRSRPSAKTDRQARGSRTLGVEDMEHTVVLDREQHITRVMRCCGGLSSPALRIGDHRLPVASESLGAQGTWMNRGRESAICIQRRPNAEHLPENAPPERRAPRRTR
jgi:hypothetical protein